MPSSSTHHKTLKIWAEHCPQQGTKKGRLWTAMKMVRPTKVSNRAGTQGLFKNCMCAFQL